MNYWLGFLPGIILETLQETGAHNCWISVSPHVAFVQVIHQVGLCCWSRSPHLPSWKQQLFAPCSSDDVFAPFLAPLIIEINIIKVTVIGLGVVKDEGVVNSMTRHGDYRELLKGPLYYACAITLTTIVFWRTSPISIAVICNLCAGDGISSSSSSSCCHYKLFLFA